MGDVAVADLRPEEALEPLSAAVRQATGVCDAVVILGGDNSITRPGIHGLGVPLHRVGLLTLDAHFDLRDLQNGLTNGNPVRALLADGLPGENVVQIGIQGFANSSEYARVAKEAGIRWIGEYETDDLPVGFHVQVELDRLASRVDALYIDLDLDVLDRAFAPACPGSRPGGLLPTEVADAAWRFGEHPKVRAMDIVEVDPTNDVADVTVLTAASFLLSFAAGLASRGGKGDT
jgi:formiminoglutamase